VRACRQVAPVMDEIAAEYDIVKVAKVDVDAGALAGRTGISSIPIFEPGRQPKAEVIGALRRRWSSRRSSRPSPK